MSEIMTLVGLGIGYLVVGPAVSGPVMSIVDGILGAAHGGGHSAGAPAASGAEIKSMVQDKIAAARANAQTQINAAKARQGLEARVLSHYP